MGVYEMLNYLNETYHGSLMNMLARSAYYCYTIKDIETGKFYSGSRGVEGCTAHDLLSKYFTSSTVIDFKKKLKQHPELFEYRIEYFKSRSAAFDAERVFHQTHRVGENRYFINAASAGSSDCGAGSVLCKDASGTIYRITVEEFATGNHLHVSKGMMNIRTDTGIKKIYVKDFDPKTQITEFEDYVLALDTTTGKTCKIPLPVFKSDSKYVGITKGIVVARDTMTNRTVSISTEEFNKSKDRYVGNTHGMVPVIDRITGEKKLVTKDCYNKELYKHHNSGKISVYSLAARQTVSISKEEYDKNSNKYTNQATKIFYKVDGKFFKSKKLLDEYYKKTRGKRLLGIGQFDIAEKFNDIESITREDHQNGKN